MQNRSEAVKYLQDHGYEAFARDWALGETIGIPVGSKRLLSDGIIIWDGILDIYPIDDEWAISDSLSPGKQDEHFPSLLEAVVAAEKIAKSKDKQPGDQI